MQACGLPVRWPLKASRSVRDADAAALDAGFASAPAGPAPASFRLGVATEGRLATSAAAGLESLAQAEEDLAALQASGCPVRWQ